MSEELRFDCAPEELLSFIEALRGKELAEQHGFCDACGVDHEDTVEVVYRFFFPTKPLQVVIHTQVPKSNPVLPSLTGLYKGCLWAERETAEMFGLTFVGHPDPRHLLLPEDWQGYPLRKDYEYPLDHPWIALDPLREDPGKTLCPAAGEDGGAEL